ncbi:MAG: PEP-CTERM system histidine kinase PrsK [Novosphingobium sp.]|nr:PEP-CTERM system histidine kinase PrsK [Novosphingobium sp.]MBX9643566.1 PEP-CTERM system histidine kinase PrsK [Novosphingobium sp.]
MSAILAGLDAAAWSLGALACLLAAAWLQRCRLRFGTARPALVLALCTTGLWALVGAAWGIDTLVEGLAESLRNLAWIFALYRLFEVDGRHALVKPVRPLLAALAFVELLQVPIEALLYARAGGSAVGFQTLTMFRLLVVTGGLVLLHNLYSGASNQARAVLRWPALALALLWGVDLNYYAIAYLSESTPQVLGVVRGLLGLPVAALLAFGGARDSESPRLRPSRAVAFQSISLLLIGGYLAAMVAMAQWLAFAGSDYAALLQIAFVAVASTIAVMVLPSERLRGWLRVTAAKHLFQHRYDYRAEWLRFTRTIGQGGQKQASLEERVIRAVADITDSPAGLLLTQSESGQFDLAARWQWPTAEVPGEALDPAAVRAIERSSYVADLDALRSGKRDRKIDFELPDWLMSEPRAWALVPLLHFERLVGVIVLARPAHARPLDWEDFDLLRVAGQQLASYLAEHSGQAALAEAARFDDFHRRIAFVMHDIKNLASQLGLLARNAEAHADNPEFRADMLVTLRNSADKLNALIARLSRYGPATHVELASLRADTVARAVLTQLHSHHPVSLVECEPIKVAADPELLEQVLLHLVQNAIDASPEDSPVFVRVAHDGLHGVIEVVDSGIGMSAEFVRTRLFKPFDSTKQGGFGIGAYEARELVRAMQGRIDVESREGLGTRFVIRLPLAETAELIKSMAAQSGDSKKVA